MRIGKNSIFLNNKLAEACLLIFPVSGEPPASQAGIFRIFIVESTGPAIITSIENLKEE